MTASIGKRSIDASDGLASLDNNGLPADSETEQAMVGGLLTAFEAGDPHAPEALRLAQASLRPGAIHLKSLNRVFEIMLALVNQDMGVNAATISAHSRGSDDGFKFSLTEVAAIADGVPRIDAAQVKSYCRFLNEYERQRAIINLCYNTIACATDSDQTALESSVARLRQQLDAKDDETQTRAAAEASIIQWPEPPSGPAYYGLAGDIVALIEPHTEADPVAILVQLLTGAGNMIGRSAFFVAEADEHYTNLFALLVGRTSKGRKGSSLGQTLKPLTSVDPEWIKRKHSGLSSGEGLIWSVRDAIEKQEPQRDKGHITGYQKIIVDDGVTDKRLLVVEPEFAQTLKVASREANTLSPIIRQAWDCGDLRTMTKNSPAVATGAHISIIGHVTREELRRNLNTTEASNGFANRFLWVCVARSRCLPDGGQLETVDFGESVRRLANAITFARGVGRMTRDDEARTLWHEVYPDLSEGKPGLFGAVTSRAEAQVGRLACIYALLDCSAIVRLPHLQAALALWKYCEASARFIFGDALGDPVADEILRALREAPAGLTRTDIRDLFGRNRSAREVGSALATLTEHGCAYSRSELTEGRPAQRWFANVSGTTKTTNTTKPTETVAEEGVSVVNVVNVVEEPGDDARSQQPFKRG